MTEAGNFILPETMSEYEKKAWTVMVQQAAQKEAAKQSRVRTGLRHRGEAISRNAERAWNALPGSDIMTDRLTVALAGLQKITVAQGLGHVSEKRVLKPFKKKHEHISTLVDLRSLDLSECDEAMPHTRMGYSIAMAAEGGASSLLVTGATVASSVSGGMTMTVAAGAIATDVTVILTVTGRIVALVAAHYGYNAKQPEEEVFALGVLSYAAAGSASAKAASLSSLSRLAQQMMRHPTWIQLNEKALVKIIAMVYAKLGYRMTHAKLAQAVPVAGVVINSGLNAEVVDRTFRRAMLAYRLRFLTDKYQLDPSLWVSSAETDGEESDEDLPQIDDVVNKVMNNGDVKESEYQDPHV